MPSTVRSSTSASDENEGFMNDIERGINRLMDDEDEPQLSSPHHQDSKTLMDNNNNNTNHNNEYVYPLRLNAEDCSYYMKFGSCKFGLRCKFNHPIAITKNQGVEESSERGGVRPDCNFYFTPRGCQYGSHCTNKHGSDTRSKSLELNYKGFPIRLGERECPYYKRTGFCMFFTKCRFHHPNPSTSDIGDPSVYGNGGSLPSLPMSSKSISPWCSPKPFRNSSPFSPTKFPPIQCAPTPIPEWNEYQAANPTFDKSLSMPPAFALNALSTEVNYAAKYPECPGELECSIFLKARDCKCKSNCKFHHSKNQSSKSKAKADSLVLSSSGLPFRPGQPICTHYQQHGVCNYGPSCKFDHPPFDFM